MRLKEMEKYEGIIIQCHDNPDADAIASGYGLYTYFKSKGKQTRLIYSGRFQIQKPNLKLMVEKLCIPIQFVEELHVGAEELLITVDCQYGAGNVKKYEAENIAIIDHHQVEIKNISSAIIDSNVGSCATLVWSLLREEGFPIHENISLGTALYYGLYSDTNQLSEIYNPMDMDMRDDLHYDKRLLVLFRNSNLTLQELEIAGIALIRYIFNDDFGYAIIKAQPCDPNILGLISDFLIQVDGIYTCVVYNQQQDGYKLSVRSCTREVKASELAEHLTAGIGSGGGHVEKAGGFISLKLYEEKYPTLHSEAYFGESMNAYFDGFDIMDANEYEMDMTEMKPYVRKKVVYGFLRMIDVMQEGTPATIRTREGDTQITAQKDTYLLVGSRGTVQILQQQEFEAGYEVTRKEFHLETPYQPTIKDRANATSMELLPLIKTCTATGEKIIYAKPLVKAVKIFTKKDRENYILGRPGDYIAVSGEGEQDIYAVSYSFFASNYRSLSESKDLKYSKIFSPSAVSERL